MRSVHRIAIGLNEGTRDSGKLDVMGTALDFETARETRRLIGTTRGLERAASRGDLARLPRGAYADAAEAREAAPIELHRGYV